MADPDRSSRVAGWSLLVLATVAVTALFHVLAVPAALLLGPMIAGIAVASRTRGLRLPGWVSTGGQAVVGCLIAGGMAGVLGPVVRAHWLLFAALSVATIGASGLIGVALSRLRVVPGTVAIWGSMPGGASAMVLMAEASGADARLVAVMVYARVVTVTVAATTLAALLGDASHPAAAAAAAAAAVARQGDAWLMPAVALAGAALALLLRWPAGTLVVSMVLGVLAQAFGFGAVRVPAPLLVVAFTAIGWRIGLSFTGEARGSALRMLPRIVAAALLLSGFSGLLALAMHVGLGIDPLTAWLAASPGGLESVAVIASSLPVDTPFIMAAQTARFGMVMLVGPALATALSRRVRAREDAGRRGQAR